MSDLYREMVSYTLLRMPDGNLGPDDLPNMLRVHSHAMLALAEAIKEQTAAMLR